MQVADRYVELRHIAKSEKLPLHDRGICTTMATAVCGTFATMTGLSYGAADDMLRKRGKFT